MPPLFETVKKGTDREETNRLVCLHLSGEVIFVYTKNRRGSRGGYYPPATVNKSPLKTYVFSRDFFTFGELALYRTIVRRRDRVHQICTLF